VVVADHDNQFWLDNGADFSIVDVGAIKLADAVIDASACCNKLACFSPGMALNDLTYVVTVKHTSLFRKGVNYGEKGFIALTQ
jgi:hypothetical protein